MTGRDDQGSMGSKTEMSTRTYTQEEVDQLLAANAGSVDGPDMTNAARAGIEEGPHLKDPEIRRAKLLHMIDAGVDPDDESLTDDMREILAERK